MKELYTVVHSAHGTLENILYTKDSITFPILEHDGKRRELQKLETLNHYEKEYSSFLPIFIGFGAGFAIEAYSKKHKPFVVIDLENLYELTREYLNIEMEHVTMLTHNNTFEYNSTLLDTVLYTLEYPLCIPIVHPFIKKHLLERYIPYIERCKTLAQFNPLGKTRYPLFTHTSPRILCLWTPSFITHEIAFALQKEGIVFEEIQVRHLESSLKTISAIIEAIHKKKPDFILTINHTGFDTSNIIATIMKLFQIPIASWFMDSPELDIEKQPMLLHDRTTVFTYDEENLPYLHSLGIKNAYYLPLGTNIEHFTPTHIPPQYSQWRAILGFLGDSREKNIQRYKQKCYTPMLHSYSQAIAETFRISTLYTVQETIAQEYPFLYDEYKTLSLIDRRDYIQLILDIATQRKRTLAIRNASIVQTTVLGDSYWKELLPHSDTVYIGEEIPYSDARYLYSQVAMVLNSTCTQMKHSVNQRVFDCPLSGALVLTEYSSQLAKLFDIGIEVVCYKSYEELQEKIQYYHNNPQERYNIVYKAQQRIRNEHTWGHRIQKIVSIMEELYK